MIPKVGTIVPDLATNVARLRTDVALFTLDRWLRGEFDRIEADTMAKFRALARSTGQRTRVDRGRVT